MIKFKDIFINNEFSINGRYHKDVNRRLLSNRVSHESYIKLDNGSIKPLKKAADYGIGPFPLASRRYSINPEQPSEFPDRWFRYSVGNNEGEVLLLDGMILKSYSPREGLIDYIPELSNQESIKKIVFFINPQSNLYIEN